MRTGPSLPSPSFSWLHDWLLPSAFAGAIWFNLDMTTQEKQTAGILEEQRNRPGMFQETVSYRVPSDDIREEAWVDKLIEAASGTTLVICGYLHFESLVQKLRARGHTVDKRVYLETVPTIKLAEPTVTRA